MESLVIPEKAIGKHELPAFVEKVRHNILAEHSPIQAYVKLYNLKVLVEQTLENLKEEALAGIQGKEMQVYGARVELKQKARTWDYGEDAHLKALEKAAMDADKLVKDWKKIRQLQKDDLVDAGTGEITPPAKQLTDGVTIAVTLPT